MDLFVYGTLRDPELMATVAGPGPYDKADALLQDYRVVPLKDDVVPLIVRANGVAKGVVWSGLKPSQIKRLDAYEGAFGYKLAEIDVISDGDTKSVHAYMPPDTAVADAGDWFLHDWHRHYQRASVLAAEEIFGASPTPDAADVQKMWRTVQMRAWARVRAQSHKPVAERRFSPSPDDWAVLHRGALMGEFFRLQAFDVEHCKFDQSSSGPLRREVFLGVDAVLVLPYDPVRDVVLLVEQPRMGPILRGDPNPWVLEPVAGMVDPRESPEDAAHRETAEEAGIQNVTLEEIHSFYPSPGSTTDYFTTYLGICDLPKTTPYAGGDEEEGEDLRVHPISFDDAMALLQSGELTSGPVGMMLYWLDRNRDRLRAASA